MTAARFAALAVVYLAASIIAVSVWSSLFARRAWLEARTARQGRRVVAEAERLLLGVAG